MGGNLGRLANRSDAVTAQLSTLCTHCEFLVDSSALPDDLQAAQTLGHHRFLSQTCQIKTEERSHLQDGGADTQVRDKRVPG